MYRKPIWISILQIIGGTLSMIAAGKIAKNEHDRKKVEKAKKQSQK